MSTTTDQAIAPPERDAHLGDLVTVNIGPSHPATHGTLRIQVQLDGEVIRRCGLEIGYLHRCFEKMVEVHPYQQGIPYAERLNYCSPFMNSAGFCMAVEALLGAEVPARARWVRVILNELSRIMDHFVCIGTNLVDLGALTNFWYFFQPREMIYTILEKCSGGRLMVNYNRIGGLAVDVSEDFVPLTRKLLADIPRFVDDVVGLVHNNRIFIDRTKGIGKVSRDEAIAWGFTGPCLRASGEGYDVRKAFPYYGYDELSWEVPVETAGDTYARYLLRVREIEQSAKIVAQALDRLEPGPVMIDDPRVALPPKEKVYGSIEGLMNHFKLIMHGLTPPKGELYHCTEGANGELGFYVVSDGTGHPYRIKVRPPCFAIYSAWEKLFEGHMVADIASILGSLNIVAGELDR